MGGSHTVQGGNWTRLALYINKFQINRYNNDNDNSIYPGSQSLVKVSPLHGGETLP